MNLDDSEAEEEKKNTMRTIPLQLNRKRQFGRTVSAPLPIKPTYVEANRFSTVQPAYEAPSRAPKRAKKSRDYESIE